LHPEGQKVTPRRKNIFRFFFNYLKKISAKNGAMQAPRLDSRFITPHNLVSVLLAHDNATTLGLPACGQQAL
jgi:hypothetical protein